ncbi:MAG TPA: 1-deoxy-D-xylulose-5-phosphate reductoisomerase [Halanaerobiales bacterium]|nr:1-deoxy-D-xylulose-5-phosphate reductoisomerase [Halanaerobiales bacterium]
MKNLILLGSTGSIGTQVLEVLDFIKEDWNVDVLTANRSVEKITKQAKKYQPRYVVMADKDSAKQVKFNLKDDNIEVLAGKKQLNEIVKLVNIDLVINALVGASGLIPTLNTIDEGTKLGLANKESLVIGGHLVKEKLKQIESENMLLPIDSEHNAIFRLLEKHSKNELKNIILTASGGPFVNKSKENLKKVTVKEALNHPNWDMGSKITIDSATMMNKGLEVIEAHWLFNVGYDKIKVIIHPQSIIHSMIELIDSSIYAEMSVADMKMPIQHVIEYPNIKKGIGKPLNLVKQGKLEFLKPDYDKFTCLKLAFEAGRKGGSYPVVLNAANEEAVDRLLNKKIKFVQIPKVIKQAIEAHQKIDKPSIEQIIEIDEWARNFVKEVV